MQTGKISLFFRYALSEIRILDVCATVPIHFVFADGLIAMEETATLNALRDLWAGLCSPTIRLRRMPPVRDSWVLGPDGSCTFAKGQGSWQC